MHGDDVKHVQQKLHDLGYLKAEPDGRFGSATKAAAEDFQRAQGLVVDGKLGPDTQQHLDAAVRDQRMPGLAHDRGALLRDFSDPSHPQNPLYNTLKDGFPPGTSPELLTQATAACYMSGIKQPADLGNVVGSGGSILFQTNAIHADNATLNTNQPAPSVQHTMQQVQQFEQQQAQINAQLQAQNAQINAQAAQQGAVMGGPPMPGGR